MLYEGHWHDPTADVVSTAILVDLLHDWTRLLPSDCTRAKYLFKIAMSSISPFDLSLIWHGPRTVAFEYYISCYLLPNGMIKQQPPGAEKTVDYHQLLVDVLCL